AAGGTAAPANTSSRTCLCQAEGRLLPAAGPAGLARICRSFSVHWIYGKNAFYFSHGEGELPVYAPAHTPPNLCRPRRFSAPLPRALELPTRIRDHALRKAPPRPSTTSDELISGVRGRPGDSEPEMEESVSPGSL